MTRRLGAAAPVARGAGIGARRPGPDPERPAGVPPRNRAAAGADGVDREHRQRQRTARDLAARLLLHAAAVDDADVARCPAHVEAQGVVHAGRACDERGPRGAARRSREDRPRRVARGRLDVDQAAVRLHDRGLGEVRLTHALGEPAQIARQQRRQRRVDLGGRGPLEFAEGADDLVRERDVGLREGLGQRVPDRLLVVGVAVGVEQRNRHRLGLGPGYAVRNFTCRFGRELDQRALRCHPLGRAEAEIFRGERRRPRGAQAVQLRAILAAERDQVREPVGGDERGAWPRALRAARWSRPSSRGRTPRPGLRSRRPWRAPPRSRRSRPRTDPQGWSAPSR